MLRHVAAWSGQGNILCEERESGIEKYREFSSFSGLPVERSHRISNQTV
jgi:hypothetical protein